MVAPTIPVTVRLPVDQYKWLKRQAKTRNTSMQKIIEAAIRQAKEAS